MSEPVMRTNDAAVELLRQVVDNQTEMRGDVKVLLTDMATVKGMDITGQLATIRANHDKLFDRVDKLEAARDSATGAVGLVGWISKAAPWLSPALAALAAWFAAKGQLPHQ